MAELPAQAVSTSSILGGLNTPPDYRRKALRRAEEYPDRTLAIFTPAYIALTIWNPIWGPAALFWLTALWGVGDAFVGCFFEAGITTASRLWYKDHNKNDHHRLLTGIKVFLIGIIALPPTLYCTLYPNTTGVLTQQLDNFFHAEGLQITLTGLLVLMLSDLIIAYIERRLAAHNVDFFEDSVTKGWLLERVSEYRRLAGRVDEDAQRLRAELVTDILARCRFLYAENSSCQNKKDEIKKQLSTLQTIDDTVDSTLAKGRQLASFWSNQLNALTPTANDQPLNTALQADATLDKSKCNYELAAKSCMLIGFIAVNITVYGTIALVLALVFHARKLSLEQAIKHNESKITALRTPNTPSETAETPSPPTSPTSPTSPPSAGSQSQVRTPP